MKHLVKVAAFSFCLLLIGCGFQLRRELVLPASLQSLRVQSPDPYSALQRGLEGALQRAGAKLVSGESKAVLRIASAQLEQRPLTVGSNGRVQEFVLEYRAEFELIDAEGKAWLPLQTVKLESDYSFDTAQPLGSPAEEELIRAELERAMVDAILRRIDAVLRS